MRRVVTVWLPCLAPAVISIGAAALVGPFMAHQFHDHDTGLLIDILASMLLGVIGGIATTTLLITRGALDFLGL